MEIRAELNYLRIAPRKIRLAASLIRGMKIREAENQLQFLTKRAANPLLKLLRSAVANAANNFNLQKENLFISKITVDKGSPLKRTRPRAFGRAFPIRKHTSHITLVLGELEGSKRAAKKAPKKKEGPVIIEEADIKEGEERKKFGKAALSEKLAPSKRPDNVIRKVFQRKAI